jgi:hypothetical protein
MSLAASSTFAGVIQLEPPASSWGPHRDGHHFGPIGVSPVACACATCVWASIPPAAMPAVTPVTRPLWRKSRRDTSSGAAGAGTASGSVFDPATTRR